MSLTMHAEGPLHVGLVGQEAWRNATKLILGDELPHVDEDIRDDWAAAGIETSRGLDPQWGRAIELTRTARVGVQLLSQFRDVLFEATVLVGGPDCVAITQRHRARDGADGPQVVGTHPMIEVALAPRDELWRLVRRVLPPLDDARAEPIAPGRAYEPLTVSLDFLPDALRDDPSALLRRVPELTELPDEVRDALHPEASVFAVGIAHAEGSHQFHDAWAVGRHGLYHMVPGQPGIFRVPPGHLGGRLLRELADLAVGRP